MKTIKSGVIAIGMVLTLPVIAGAEDLSQAAQSRQSTSESSGRVLASPSAITEDAGSVTAPSAKPKPKPKEFMRGFVATATRRSTRLLRDPLIVFFPLVHPLRASLYAEQHGYSAAAGLGTTGAAWVAALKK